MIKIKEMCEVDQDLAPEMAGNREALGGHLAMTIVQNQGTTAGEAETDLQDAISSVSTTPKETEAGKEITGIRTAKIIGVADLITSIMAGESITRDHKKKTVDPRTFI